MSNNFTEEVGVGIETRNKRRIKPSYGAVDQNEDEHSDPLKRLKTENNSRSKNILNNNVHANESLQLLKNVAANNDE